MQGPPPREYPAVPHSGRALRDMAGAGKRRRIRGLMRLEFLSFFPIKKMSSRVSTMAQASHDVMVIHLQLPVSDVFKYHAGQYVGFLLRDGDRRSYSIGNAPHTQTEDPGVEFHIRPAEPALCTSPCWRTFPTCRAIRFMPVVRPSWSIRRARTTARWVLCPKKSFLRTRSRPKRTRPKRWPEPLDPRSALLPTRSGRLMDGAC